MALADAIATISFGGSQCVSPLVQQLEVQVPPMRGATAPGVIGAIRGRERELAGAPRSEAVPPALRDTCVLPGPNQPVLPARDPEAIGRTSLFASGAPKSSEKTGRFNA